MKQTSGFISTYSADAFGVCSALYELGGLIVMHDASGCNSTYTTHDEPRWYDMDSMVYISGLTEIEAIMGDDSRLIDDIVNAAAELHPRFIAIVGTTIPAMTGFDADAAARVVESRTGIKTYGFKTTGMRSYVHGVSEAFLALADTVSEKYREKQKTEEESGDSLGAGNEKSVNIIGLTPLDFSINGSDKAIKTYYEAKGYKVISTWAMGSSMEEILEAPKAGLNIVVSEAGISAAKKMKEEFGLPFKVGIPVGGEDIDISNLFGAEADLSRSETVSTPVKESYSDCDCIIIGEAVSSYSLAEYLKRKTGRNIGVIVSTDLDEDGIADALLTAPDACTVIADPLFKPLLKNKKLIRLPHEAFSGRLYRDEIPDIVTDGKWLSDCTGVIARI
ncbi:MAG: oxidoreductase [Lachnospiraceae bacterium]|nr:oxidoreductase [Lachnospiraceae bacterium]MBR3579987.1 oxidoreductase [Lachnospiraceae bacterium]MBR4542193.1 oxidoreductase [Lachnospiraceae bacterium]